MARKVKQYTLVGVNGNAYCIMGYVLRAMRECYSIGYDSAFDKAAQDEFIKNAESSNYDNLVCVSANKIDELNDYIMTH